MWLTVRNNYANHDFLLLKTLNAFIWKLQFSSQPDTLLKQISTDYWQDSDNFLWNFILFYFRSAPFEQKSIYQKNPTYFSSYSYVHCVIEKTSVTHYNSKITGTVCPAVSLPEIKASSKNGYTVVILTFVALKKLVCTVNYRCNKNPIL